MIKLVCIMKSNYVTAEKMIRGFTDCGQHVEDAEHGKSPTVDYDKVMKRCYQEVTEDQKQCMKDNREIFGREFAETGRVTNEFLDHLGIVKDPEDAPNRDVLNALARQDCQIITNDDTVRRFREYQQQKADSLDPVLVEEKKIMSKSERLVYSAEKKQATKEKKALERKQEQERRSKLTKAERDQEDAEKKKKTAQEKKEKDNQAAAALLAAQEMIGAEKEAAIKAKVREDANVNGNNEDEDDVLEEDGEEA